ncbi:MULTISPECIES: hypothetical protein [Paenibacillus]|uniref:Uncharacterized protein n=1 Tax=Paenibacillus albilobatus TaxID=2716884 RepID=A0A919XEX2_9BACL|nr:MULTISPECIES: hypothetical protein [Paenibacillus]MDR9853864.1 hypothetical protein [Paenibacillus sp. VCA1]GIO30916.1 hypothetical protein J2TS6_20570 [Paenibacillus albilobatus]
MKLRPIPIAITVVISAALLFGGWFIYRQTTMQGPLQKIVQNYKGVNNAQFDISRNQINLKLDLKPDTNLSGLVNQITTQGKSVVGNRELNFDFVDHSSDKLNRFWDSAMFSVAEAMDNKKYTEIPAKLDQLAKDTGIKTQTEMDAKNVYIGLSDGEHSKFIVLPRNPGKIGVWE